MLLATVVVTTDADSGAGSLRAAIALANATPGRDVIEFAIGSGRATIDLLRPLPAIEDPVTIDGRTQDGYRGAPLVELNGAAAGADADGLVVNPSGGGSVIRGLAVNRFGGDGIVLLGDGTGSSGGNTVAECHVGVGTDGKSDLGNGGDGIDVASSGNRIGATAAGFRGNVISGNGRFGVHLHAGTFIGGGGAIRRDPASGNVVAGSFIGTSNTGDAALPNVLGGIWIESAGNTVGGTGRSERNVISGNTANGILVAPTDAASASASAGNAIRGNYIGLAADGVTALANGVHGIEVAGGDADSPCLVGGAEPGAGNVISGNQRDGVHVSRGVAHVKGNRIGTTADGSAAVENLGGVHLYYADGNLVGGEEPGAGNLISGNRGYGVRVFSRGNTVQGNLIGTNATGTRAVANAGSGIELWQGANLIGGTTAAARNVISGNRVAQVRVSAAFDPDPNRVYGNFIGTDLAGTGPIAGGGRGVEIPDRSRLQLGGSEPGQPNRIAFNTFGIAVWPTAVNEGQVFSRNEIFSNTTLGIGIGPGSYGTPTPNDRLDVDTIEVPPNDPTGPQNYPLLTSAVARADGLRVAGILDSTASAEFEVEFFSAPQAHASGHGEGALFLGAATVATNADGFATFDLGLPAVTPGHFVSATARRVSSSAPLPAGSTSEFSHALEVRAEPQPAPRVTAVHVAAGNWSQSFKDDLAAGGLGSALLGLSVRGGADQADVLPWLGVDRLSVTFDADVRAAAGDLRVYGSNVPEYALAPQPNDFAYDPGTRTATWRLAGGVGGDRLLLVLESDARARGVRSVFGDVPLDGEWAQPQAFPSGDGTSGGDFLFRLSALPGDATGDGRVNALDLAYVRQRLGSTTTTDAGAGYTAAGDLTGDGRINALDLAAVRQRLNTRLPTAEPQPPPPAAFAPPAPPAPFADAARRAPSATRDVLGQQGMD